MVENTNSFLWRNEEIHSVEDMIGLDLAVQSLKDQLRWSVENISMRQSFINTSLVLVSQLKMPKWHRSSEMQGIPETVETELVKTSCTGIKKKLYLNQET